MGHFFERRGDQAGQADDVHLVLDRGFQDVVAGNHDAEVDDVVAVAAEHDADDVLADVVHVALDRRHQDLALAAQAGAGLFRFDVGQQMGDRLLHDAGRFDHLRQEHLAGAEEVADVVHAVHQRAFDDGERRLAFGFQLGAHFLGIGHDEIGDALDQRMFEALLDRAFAPAQIRPGVFGLAFLDGHSEFDQRFAGTRMAVEHHILDLLAQRRLQIVVDAEHAGIDDAHGHAGLNGVVEEDGVDRLAHGIVAAERKGDVGNAAGNVGVRQVLLDPAHRIDEIDGVVVVFGNAGGDGENVRVEDDVLGREADAEQQIVGALADFRLAAQVSAWPFSSKAMTITAAP
jgi:hypothetical protein